MNDERKLYHRKKAKEQYERYKEKQKISILGNYYLDKIHNSRENYLHINECVVDMLKNCNNMEVWNNVCEKLLIDELI